MACMASFIGATLAMLSVLAPVDTPCALAWACTTLGHGQAKGYKSIFAAPNVISEEKIALMRLFGAEVRLQPLVPFADPRYFVHEAERLGELPGHVFLNQVQRSLPQWFRARFPTPYHRPACENSLCSS
jgi:hypothetical protein